MSITCRTIVYPLVMDEVGMVKFEHDKNANMVTIWFLPSADTPDSIASWNGLTINKNPHTYISSVAREVWHDLVRRGFDAP